MLLRMGRKMQAARSSENVLCGLPEKPGRLIRRSGSGLCLSAGAVSWCALLSQPQFQRRPCDRSRGFLKLVAS